MMNRILSLGLAMMALCPPAAWSDQGHWTEAGSLPSAALQPTEWGRTIQTIAVYNGRLYLGYGDYGANTGPITITSYDPVAGTFSNEWTSMTECIDTYRVISGRLYAPAIDPRGEPPQAAGYAVGTPERQWRDDPVFMEHAYDMATLTGDDLWLVGSYGDFHSVALRSLDGGASWKKELDLFRDGDRMSRFYFVCVLDGILYVQSSSDTNSTSYDGKQWGPGPRLVHNGRHPVNFAGKIVIQQGSVPYLQGGGPLMVFDGEHEATLLPLETAVWDFCVDSRVLYALQTNMLVKATADLENWTTVAAAPANARSLAVAEGQLYVGTSDSRLLTFGESIERPR
jgi:hypothetical protein